MLDKRFTLCFTLILLSSVCFASEEPIEQHLFCHSHDDLGWLLTVDQYYEQSVRNIFLTTLDALEAQTKTDWRLVRKFVYSEVGFLKKFLLEADGKHLEERRARIQRAIERRQWDWVNGGISQADSACTHFEDIASNYFAGQRFLKKHFGTVSHIAWQLDPFGHSRGLFFIARKFNMFHGFIVRIPGWRKALWSSQRNLEFKWRLHENEYIKTHVLLQYGAPKSLSCDTNCDPKKFNQGLYKLETMLNNKIHRYSNPFMIGGDFAWTKAASRFDFLDHVLELNPKSRYSTPAEYAMVFDGSSDWKSLNTFDGDFFVYDEGVPGINDAWSGYFTTKPRLKYLIRKVQMLLREIKQVVGYQWNYHPEKWRSAVADFLADLQEEAGVLLHHDCITGTAKLAVDADYIQRIKNIEKKAFEFEASSTSKGQSSKLFLSNSLQGGSLEVGLCDPNEIITGHLSECVHFNGFNQGLPEGVFTIQNAIGREDRVNTIIVPDPGETFAIQLTDKGGSQVPFLRFCQRRQGYCELYFQEFFHDIDTQSVYSVQKVPKTSESEGQQKILEVDLTEELQTFPIGESKIIISQSELSYLTFIKTKTGEVVQVVTKVRYGFLRAVRSGHYILKYHGFTKVEPYNRYNKMIIYMNEFMMVIHVSGDKIETTLKFSRGESTFKVESLVKNVTDFASGIDVLLFIENEEIKNYNKVFYSDSNGLFEEKRQSGPIFEDNVFPVTTHARVDPGVGKFGMIVFNDRSQGAFATEHGLAFYIQRSATTQDRKGNDEVLSVNEDVLVAHSIMHFYEEYNMEEYLKQRNLHDSLLGVYYYSRDQNGGKMEILEKNNEQSVQLWQNLRSLRINFEIVDKDTILLRFYNISPIDPVDVPLGNMIRTYLKRARYNLVNFDYVYGKQDAQGTPEFVYLKPFEFVTVTVNSVQEKEVEEAEA